MEHVQALAVIGANRASIGVQDTDPNVQLAIHRWQPAALNHQAVDWLRQAGFRSVSVDLIYGLPRQNETTFGHTIDDVLALRPDRLSVFSYAHVPRLKPSQRIFDSRGELPPPEEKLAMAAVAREKLTRAGYIDIGLDHFARPDDELAVAQRNGTLQRNFQGYSTAAGASLYAFGISSISSTQDSYRQNFKSLDKWRAALDAGRLPVERGLILTQEDRRRRTLIMRLMCDRRIDFAALSRELGVDVEKEYSEEISDLNDLEADGLLFRSVDAIEVLPRGVPLLRVIAMRFDSTFNPADGHHAQTDLDPAPDAVRHPGANRKPGGRPAATLAGTRGCATLFRQRPNIGDEGLDIVVGELVSKRAHLLFSARVLSGPPLSASPPVRR